MQGHNLLFSMTLDVSLERIKQSLLMNFMSLKITKLTFALQFKGKKNLLAFIYVYVTLLTLILKATVLYGKDLAKSYVIQEISGLHEG